MAGQARSSISLCRSLIYRLGSGFIAFEDLNIKDMVHNHGLAKSISDAKLGICR
jgi:transposase